MPKNVCPFFPKNCALCLRVIAPPTQYNKNFFFFRQKNLYNLRSNGHHLVHLTAYQNDHYDCPWLWNGRRSRHHLHFLSCLQHCGKSRAATKWHTFWIESAAGGPKTKNGSTGIVVCLLTIIFFAPKPFRWDHGNNPVIIFGSFLLEECNFAKFKMLYLVKKIW